MTIHRDPVTKAPVPDAGPLTWGLIGVPPDADVKAVADALYEWLDEQGRGQDGYPPDDVPMVDHASDSYVTDHVLLTSAIAYCLAYDELLANDLQLIRLAALSHELADRDVVADRLPDQREFLEDAWDMLEEQGRRLEAAFEEEDSLSAFDGATAPFEDECLTFLWKAHLAASRRLHNAVWDDPEASDQDWRRILSLQSKTDFEQHPLKDAGRLALVFGLQVDGQPFEDVATKDQAGAAFTAIYQQVQKHKQAGHRIHLSIAGGRKSMSVYGMAVAQLLFDAEDRLWHILSHPTFEESDAMHTDRPEDVPLVRIPVLPYHYFVPALPALLIAEDPMSAVERQQNLLTLEQRKRRHEFLTHERASIPN